VAQDRRLKAMRAMLRDEQEERVEQLDKSYRQLHKMGLLLSGKGAETMQNERISSDQEQNQKVVEESADPYDSMVPRIAQLKLYFFTILFSITSYNSNQ
jgi:hypothetical protein